MGIQERGQGIMEFVILFCWIVCGVGASLIANSKGASGCLWFGLGILLGPLGLILAMFSGSKKG